MKDNYGYGLDPCPFCGGKPILVRIDKHHSYSDEDRGFVRCSKCEIEQAWSVPLEEAVERWNTRCPEK